MPWRFNFIDMLNFVKDHSQLLFSLAFPVTLFIIGNYISRKLRLRPLPINWPVFGILPSVAVNLQQIHDYLTSLLIETNGTLETKMGWDVVLTSDPANVNHILNLNFGNYPKGRDYREIFDVLGDGMFNIDGESWKSQRKMAHGVLIDQKFQSFHASSNRSKVDKALIPFLNQMADIGKVFDLDDVLSRFTFDATCTMVFGIDPDTLTANLPASPVSKALEVVEEVLFIRHIFPRFFWKILRWLNIWEEKKLKEAMDLIDEFIAQTMKMIDGNTATSIHWKYMDLGVSRFDDKFFRDTMLTFLFAGKDTIGVMLSWFFYLVSMNPAVEEKILHELREHIEYLNDSNVDHLTYLHASLCESLRLYPPLPINPKQSLETDILPSGHKVSPGKKIFISLYAMGRMPSIWGEDCLEFRPERWISNEGNLRQPPTYKFTAFNSGPRTCLGRDVAFKQTKIVAAAMINNFEIKLIDGQKIESGLSVILPMKNGMLVKVKKRTYM